jgi:rubrerythrin
MVFQSFEEVIEFAISREIEAADFYNKLQSLVKHESSIKLLKELENMELAHAEILKKFDKSEIEGEYISPKIQNLKIADSMEDISPQSEMNYQEILVLSIKAEQHANELYLKLADESENQLTKNVFLRLADEEAKHKLHLEQIYDDEFMVEN